MINPVIERRYADCSELIDAWKNFLDMFTSTVKAEDARGITGEMEQRFMEVKARIAMLHDSFMESLKHDRNIGQNMLALVNRSITLRHLRKLPSSDQKKVEIEWHQCYLLLNETVGQLAEERERLANVNEFTHKLSRIRETVFLQLKYFFTSIYFKIILAIGILVAVIVFMPASVWERVRENDRLGGPFGAVLDFKRDTLGLGGAYSSVEKFRETQLDDLGPGYTVSDSSNTKESASSWASGMFDVSGQDAADFLRNATEFDAVTIRPDDAPQMDASVYYWFDASNAAQFAVAFRTAASDVNNPSSQFLDQVATVAVDNNVLVVLTNGNEAARGAVAAMLR